ncbi:MAG TPA: hypothetical protein DC047_14535 [Blastocatellia bacterium]|nr:hypothetical protein [Blastocatellia bacterium]
MVEEKAVGGRRIPDSRFQIPEFRFEISDSRFQIPDSRFQIQDSRFKGQRPSAARNHVIKMTIKESL